MSNYDDLTILLTLKDRVPFTSRWMSYADKVRFPFKVLIADGGTEDGARMLLEGKETFPNVNYEYVRFPPDRSYRDYYAKIVKALGQVRTPYVAMADNDDFFFPDALGEAVQFLSAHPGYVSCGGQGAVFWVRPPAAVADAGLLYGEGVDWKCTRDARSIDDDSAKERILSQARSAAVTFFYDVKRIDEARKQFGLVQDLNLRDLFLMEHLIRFLTAVAGKSKRLDRLHLARQHNAPQTSSGLHTEAFGDWFGRMLVRTWSDDFEKFVETVTTALAARDGIPADEARHGVVQAYRMLVAPQLLTDLLDEPTSTLSMSTLVPVIRRIVGLPESNVIKRLARNLYRRAGWISPESVYGTELISKPITEAERDFRPIAEFLRSGQQTKA